MTTSTLNARPHVIDGLTRRRFIGGVSMAALLAACGRDSDPAPPATGDAAGGSGFPVTIAHKYGSTTIPAQPQRVVTVGFTDPDFILALGVKPVAITDWYGDYPLGVWPWAQQALGDANPGVMPRPEGDKLNFELIAGVESRFATARREHRGFTGAELVVAERFEAGTAYIRTADEPQNGLFRELGFVQPEPIAQLLTDEDGYSGSLSDERMELLDAASVVVWKLFVGTDESGLQQSQVPDELAKHPLYPRLTVAQEGRDVSSTTKPCSGK